MSTHVDVPHGNTRSYSSRLLTRSCGARKLVHAPPGYDDFRALLVQWSSKLTTSRAGNAIKEGLGQ